MIKKQTFIMTLVDMLTHINKYTYLYATPEAEPRGILLIKNRKDENDSDNIIFEIEKPAANNN